MKATNAIMITLSILLLIQCQSVDPEKNNKNELIKKPNQILIKKQSSDYKRTVFGKIDQSFEIWIISDSTLLILHSLQCVSEYKLRPSSKNSAVQEIEWMSKYGCKYKTKLDSLKTLGLTIPKENEIFAQLQYISDSLVLIQYLPAYQPLIQAINHAETHNDYGAYVGNFYPTDTDTLKRQQIN